MKKMLLCFIAISIVVGVLSACSVDTANKQDEAPTLLWYIHGKEQTGLGSVLDAINKITVEKIGAKVNIQFIDASSYDQRMKMNMASQIGFDLFFTGHVNNYATAVGNGGLLELDNLLEKTPALKEAIPQFMWDTAKIDGHIYAVPNYQIVATSTRIAIKKDLAEKYGLDAGEIKNIRDLEPFFAKIKAGEPNYYCLTYDAGGLCYFFDDVYERFDTDGMAGLVVSKKTGEPKVVYETQEYWDALATVRDWYKKGYIRNDIITAKASMATEIDRYAVSTFVGKPGADEIKGLDKYVFADICPPYVLPRSCLNAMTGINSGSKNPKLAIKLIELVNADKELFNLICWGIEGKHYTKSEDGRVTPIADSGYYLPQESWKFGKVYNAYLQSNQPLDTWEKTEDLNFNSPKSKILGFTFNSTSVATELAQLATVRKSYEGFEYGMFDLGDEALKKEYMHKLNEAGQQRVFREAKSQIEEVIKNKK